MGKLMIMCRLVRFLYNKSSHHLCGLCRANFFPVANDSTKSHKLHGYANFDQYDLQPLVLMAIERLPIEPEKPFMGAVARDP